MDNYHEVTVALAADVDSVASGDSVSFNVTLTGVADTTQTVQWGLWARYPAAGEFTIHDADTLSIQGGEVFNQVVVADVPAKAPLGNYVIIARVISESMRLLDIDSVPMKVVPPVPRRRTDSRVLPLADPR